ncbi:hypothetical protein OIE69_44340 (plasmid) [Actinacidiphila glaucinigra]|uniref:hypothetical protein n=1 Tax=Actinacidiphila glaucinigra TaxID=235986 RepID=UPI002DDB5235|nr:hypothetical protein [Actinacidiphila glaucinigra]WSD65935.1 hypothetical protein OIE69_44340 [Actinacidiphila glaucinigra]
MTTTVAPARRTVTAAVTVQGPAEAAVVAAGAVAPGACRNRHCGRRGTPRPGDVYCDPCADDADDHDQGRHDRDSREHCPVCQP